MGRILDEILSNIQGLEPKAVLILGSGFAREEWKTLCFQHTYSLISPSIQETLRLASLLVPESNTRLMLPPARVELLRQAFRNQELRHALPLLSHQRARPRYFEKLDQILQKGRMNFAHAAEAEVISSQLVEKTGNRQKREEFFLLNRYWERLLEVRELWDEARLYEDAVQKLMHGEPSLYSLYYRVEHTKECPRVEWFWSEVAKKTEVKSVSSDQLLRESVSVGERSASGLKRKRAHSLEDAANFLLDEVSTDISRQVVVIQDLPVVRRTLKRVAEQRGISLLDSRDPTLVIQSEALKLALLDLELCAKGFSRGVMLEWIRAFHPKDKEYRKKIIERGVIQGLNAYRHLPELYLCLQKLNESYSSRITLDQLRESILASIQNHALPTWTGKVMDRLFEEWESSLAQIGVARQKKPIRSWLEQLQERLKQVNPVIDPVKNRVGLRLYRVDQCPSLLLDSKNTVVHFFGVENSYFEAKETQGEWFSVRDQEILASEFGWTSSLEKSVQNRRSFELWSAYGGSTFWEYEYDESGNETEGFDFVFDTTEKHPCELIGAHSRLIDSWKGASSPLRVAEAVIPPTKDPAQQEAWPFSFVHSYGNCPFIAFAQHLLNLQEERDVEVELSSDRFGVLLHTALEEVLKNPQAIEEAFEIAWEKTPPIAWEKNERWYHATRNHVLEILHRFVDDEAAFHTRSQSVPLHIEKEVTLSLGGLPLRGRIDRVDQHEDGLIVMDYKTGSGYSAGQETLESGKNLQLGLYALAAREVFQSEVITAQYVLLDAQKINRNSGFLFGGWNQSKKTDEVKRPVSTARSNSRSLFQEEPATIWTSVKGKVEELAKSIQEGKFPALPADPLDCARCRFRGVCGEARKAV